MSMLSPPHLLNSSRWNNLRIGLLGGSFNPPHEGHIHISLAAQKALMLDAIWWLVTPQNPIKSEKAPNMDERIQLCQNISENYPQILVSDIERSLGTNITFRTIQKLKRFYPNVNMVWISGMDNALGLHNWNNWKELLSEIPTAHLTRKPATSLIQNCPLRMYSKQAHKFIEKAAKYPLEPGITYWMLQKKMVNISSTEIRKKRESN